MLAMLAFVAGVFIGYLIRISEFVRDAQAAATNIANRGTRDRVQ